MTPPSSSVVIAHLRREQANVVQLYLQYKGYHWNVSGPLFRELHLLFDEHAGILIGQIDELAERQRILGAPAPYTLDEMRHDASIHADVALPGGPKAMVERLLTSHHRIMEGLRDAISLAGEHNDPGTADLFVRVLLAHEKMEWFLREHLHTTPTAPDEGIATSAMSGARLGLGHAVSFEHATTLPEHPTP